MLQTKNAEFPLDKDLIYLNHAAVSPLPQSTVNAVQDFLQQNLTFGAKNYVQWLATEQHLRQQLQILLNAPSTDDIALLKNTSEALSAVAYGLKWQHGDNIIMPKYEFPSNRIVWESLHNQGVITKQADIYHKPEEAIFALVDRKTRLIAVSSVHYATGIKLNLERIGEFCRKKGILFCVDAIQSLGALPIDVQAAQADFVMADGHKWLLSAEGLAVFYSTPQAREQLQLTQYGWHTVEDLYAYDAEHWQITSTARKFECGSPNMLGIHALDASISLILTVGLPNIATQILANSNYLTTELNQLNQLKILSPNPAQSGIVSFTTGSPQTDMQLFNALKQADIICAQRGGGIRLSPHFYTPSQQLTQTIAFIAAWQD